MVHTTKSNHVQVICQSIPLKWKQIIFVLLAFQSGIILSATVEMFFLFVCFLFFFFPPSSNYQQHMKKHELMHHLVCNGDMKVDWNGASPTILPDFIRNQSEQWWCPCFIAITSWNHHLLTYWYFKIKNKLNSTASLNYVVQIWHKMSGDVARPSWVEPRACGSVKQAQDFHPGDPCAVHVPC